MDLLQELTAVLEAENQLLERLIELSSKKKDEINNAQEVARLAGQEHKILTKLETVDNERAVLFDTIAPGRGVEEWVLQLRDEDQVQVAPLLTRLAENLADLQSLNHLNQELLAESLAYVQFSLNVLLVDGTGPTYARTGASSQSKTIFDRKV
ncbi:MAG: flagellar protein FlgN [Firmicutes bacterium]|nr:flagellar protein FlgN [Bacillota bacterium]